MWKDIQKAVDPISSANALNTDSFAVAIQFPSAIMNRMIHSERVLSSAFLGFCFLIDEIMYKNHMLGSAVNLIR